MIIKSTDMAGRLIGFGTIIYFLLFLCAPKMSPSRLEKLLLHERINETWVSQTLGIIRYPAPNSINLPHWTTWLIANYNRPDAKNSFQLAAFQKSVGLSEEIMNSRLKQLVFLFPMWFSFVLFGFAEGLIIRWKNQEMSRPFGLESSFTIALGIFLLFFLFLPFYLITIAFSVNMRIFALFYGIIQGVFAYWATAIKPS